MDISDKKMKINILSNDFTYPNIRSFLYPFILYKSFFESNGYFFSFAKENQLNKSDFIFLESNYFSSFSKNKKFLLKKIKNLRNFTKKIIYFDTSDSTYILHPFLLDYVDVYCKGQILRKKELYKKKFYGNRIFTEFCYQKYTIKDERESYSESLNSEKNLQKIKVFWNSCVMNYSLTGKIVNHMYQKIPCRNFIFFPKKEKFKKTKDFFYNMNLDYSRKTVSWHRKTALKKLFKIENVKKKNIFKYYKDLSLSKVCLSPFGWGEINYRDYESFLYGAILLKPNMDHVLTWPDLYNKKNYVPYNWSCNNLKTTAEKIIDEYNSYKDIANNGQNFYLNFLNNKNLKHVFLSRIKTLIYDTN